MHDPIHFARNLFLLLACGPLIAQEPKLPDDPLAAIERMPVEKPVADGIRVRVVGPEAKPLAGVSVLVLPGPRTLDRDRVRNLREAAMKKFGRDRTRVSCTMLVVFGKRYVTGDDGIAHVPKLGERNTVVAVRGEALAYASGRQAKDGVVELALLPDRDLHLLVVGPNGRPARGVPVAIVSDTRFMSAIPMSVKTDRKGRAQLKLGREYQSADKLFVRAIAVARKPIAQEFDPKKLVNDADKPIKLTLPEFGRLRVQLLGADGKALPIDGAIARVIGANDPFAGMMSEVRADSVAKNSATFTVVEVGLTLEVSAIYDGKRRPQTVSTAGPDRHMGSKLVTITGVTAPVRLKGRVLGIDGKPVASEPVGVIFMTGTSFDGQELRTDASGGIEVVIPDQLAKADSVRMLLVRRLAGGKPPPRFLGAREVSLDSARVKGLGDVRLVEEDRIATGRVVDANGKPIADVRVSVPSIYGEFNSSGRSGSPEFFETATTTDANGRFELRALGAAEGPFELTASRSGHKLLAKPRVAAGSRGVDLVMATTQSIHGRFVGLRGDKNLDVHIVARARDGSTVEGYAIDSKGGFEIHDLLAGEYTVTFAVRPAADEPFLTIDKVKVEADKPCRDARLQAIDLSEHLRIVKVTVRGPGKKPVEATVWQYHMKASGGWSGSGRRTENGVAYLPLPKQGANVAVEASDGTLRPKRLPSLDKDVVVELEPALRVQLGVKGIPELPDGVALMATVFPPTRNRAKREDAWGPGRFRRSQRSVPRDGKLEFFADEPGAYRLRLSPATTAGRAIARAGKPLEVELVVPEATGGGPAKVEITLDETQRAILAEQLQAAKNSRQSPRR